MFNLHFSTHQAFVQTRLAPVKTTQQLGHLTLRCPRGKQKSKHIRTYFCPLAAGVFLLKVPPSQRHHLAYNATVIFCAKCRQGRKGRPAQLSYSSCNALLLILTPLQPPSSGNCLALSPKTASMCGSTKCGRFYVSYHSTRVSWISLGQLLRPTLCAVSKTSLSTTSRLQQQQDRPKWKLYWTWSARMHQNSTLIT